MDHPLSPDTLAHLVPSACEFNEQGDHVLSEVAEHFLCAMHRLLRLVTYVEWYGIEKKEHPLLAHLIEAKKDMVTTLRLSFPLAKSEELNVTKHLRSCISEELMADLAMTNAQEVERLHRLPSLRSMVEGYSQLMDETKEIALLPGQRSKTTTFLKAYTALGTGGVIQRAQLWCCTTTMKCLESGVPFF